MSIDNSYFGSAENPISDECTQFDPGCPLYSPLCPSVEPGPQPEPPDPPVPPTPGPTVYYFILKSYDGKNTVWSDEIYNSMYPILNNRYVYFDDYQYTKGIYIQYLYMGLYIDTELVFDLSLFDGVSLSQLGSAVSSGTVLCTGGNSTSISSDVSVYAIPKQLEITDLTGYTWTAGNINYIPYCSSDYSLLFQSNENLFSSMRMSSGYGTYFCIYYDETLAYSYEWHSNSYKTIHIIGGEDATRHDLIVWFMTNGTLTKSSTPSTYVNLSTLSLSAGRHTLSVKSKKTNLLPSSFVNIDYIKN